MYKNSNRIFTIKILCSASDLIFLLAAQSPAASLYPPMDNGELDLPDRPFDYFSRPTTVLGTLYGENGFEATPEGSLFSGAAEIGFFAGPDLAPVNQRVKTLERGYLPIVNMEFGIDGVNYHIQQYATFLDANTEDTFVAAIRIAASNPGDSEKAARFGAGMRYGVNLPNRIQAHFSDQLEKLKYTFNPKWKYAIHSDATTRHGKMIYAYDAPPDESFIKEGEPYDKSQKYMQAPHSPADWMAISAWSRSLAPGETATVHLLMPFDPASPQLMDKVRAFDYDAGLKAVADGWESWLASGSTISVPEKKVNDHFKANLIYLAIAMDHTAGDYIQKVNEFQYDHFWLRDAAFILNAFGSLGHPFESEMGSLYFLKWQPESGNFESQRGQLDGFGQTLWTFGRHYELTRDKDYLKKVWPAFVKSLAWLHKVREEEKRRVGEGALGYGTMPISNPGDNELVDGHVVGHDIWALHGLEYMRRAAPEAATPEEFEALDAEMADYRPLFDWNLAQAAKRTGGFITPALEPGGYDWANLKLIWPTRVLKPFDPRVTETLRMARYKFQEGIMTYADGSSLHHYIGIDVPQSELIRGEQTPALHDFYSLIAHTSSTHGGFEWNIKPWGDREFGKNIAPHGCYAGKFLLLYRNMMVREDGSDLHFGSALSPWWLRPGEKIQVAGVPTAFGPTGFSVESRADGATIRIDPPARSQPDQIFFHLPPGFSLASLSAGQAVQQPDSSFAILFGPGATGAEIKWSVAEPVDYTFKSIVENYLDVYWSLHKSERARGALFEED